MSQDRREYHRQYAREHQAERTAYMRGYQKRRAAELRAQIFEALGNRCANCGIEDVRVLTIDHRHGGGTAHRSQRRQSSLTYYREILANLDAFRLLCWNCNWLAHRYEPGI